MSDKCPVCKGKGYIYEESGYDPYGGWHEQWPCKDCLGTGLVLPPRWEDEQVDKAVSTMLDHLVNDKEQSA